jgi:pimeloyl-ACP methyl ester carboxylesterase
LAAYVLLHGAWHGSWCWNRVSPILRAAGHEVYTPTLTGLGERSHLLTPEPGVSTHVQDLINVFEYEDLHDVILVGHSYGGMVLSGAAASIHHRVRHMVYLDALVPQKDGASVYSTIGLSREPPPDGMVAPPSTFGVDEPEDVAWITEKMTPQAFNCFVEPLRIDKPVEDYLFKRTWILCTEQQLMQNATRDRLRANPAWQVIEIDEVHDVMVTAPQRLAQVLLDFDTRQATK